MILLKGNQLVHVDMSEDYNSTIIAVKSSDESNLVEWLIYQSNTRADVIEYIFYLY